MRVLAESGRFYPNQKGCIERTYISDLSKIGIQGKCVAIYRLTCHAIDARNVADVRCIISYINIITLLQYTIVMCYVLSAILLHVT